MILFGPFLRANPTLLQFVTNHALTITKKYICSQEMELLAIGDATCERDCFPKLFFEKEPIENKPYFYYGFLLTKNCG